MSSMRSMVLDQPGKPLVLRQRPLPQPGPGEILLEIKACRQSISWKASFGTTGTSVLLSSRRHDLERTARSQYWFAVGEDHAGRMRQRPSYAVDLAAGLQPITDLGRRKIIERQA